MKQVLILMAFFFVGLSTSIAQRDKPDGPPPPHDRMDRGHRGEMRGPVDHEERMDEIISRLKDQAAITSVQEQKIRAILEQTTAQIKAQEAQLKPQMEAMRQQIEQLKASGATRDEIRSQMRELKEKNGPQMEQFKDKLRQIRTDSKKQINDVLTTEQKAKLYEQMSENGPDNKQKMKEKYKKKN